MDFWEAILDEGIPYKNYYDDDEDKYEINGWNFELCSAIISRDVDKVKQCLENGAGSVRILSYDRLWCNVFNSSEKQKLEEIIRLLVKNGADVNVDTKYGISVLVCAISLDSVSLLRFLVENGANIDGNVLCLQMCHCASQRCSCTITDEVCKYLIQFKEVQNACISLVASYRESYRKKQQLMINIFSKCIKCGMDINATNDNGETSLMSACQKGYLDLVLVLVAGGADINAKDNNGKTVLNYAAEGGNAEIIKLLLSQGANIGKTL